MAAERQRDPTCVVSAERRIGRPAAAVYALLADLERHWPLLGDDLIWARAADGASGATLELRGPLPSIRRRVSTEVTHARPPESFGGIAVAGASSALIDWRLTALQAEETSVTLTVTIDAGTLLDRTLLLAARPWLASRCRGVLARLEAELGAEGA